MWHVSSRSGVVLVAQTVIRFLTLPYLYLEFTVRGVKGEQGVWETEGPLRGLETEP